MNWQQYILKIKELITIIPDSNFDLIIGIARGGWIPAEAISRAFNVPLAVIFAKSYYQREKVELVTSPLLSPILPQGEILLVDDISDTGETLYKIKKGLLEDNTKIFNVKTAVIWKKQKSIFIPDFFVEEISDKWIDQPIEEFDNFL